MGRVQTKVIPHTIHTFKHTCAHTGTVSGVLDIWSPCNDAPDQSHRNFREYAGEIFFGVIFSDGDLG